MCHFSLTPFGIFSLFSVFWCLIIMCLGVNFFKFVFEIQSASLLQNLGKFQLFFLRIYFFSSCFLFSFWNSNDPNVSSFVIVLVVVEVLFIYLFFNLFSLCSLDWVISIVLFSSSLILSSIFSIMVETIYWILKFQLLHIFSSKISIWFFFLSSIALRWLSIFICFKCVCNCLLKYFYNDYFKIVVR